MNSSERYEQARHLIKSGQFQEARHVLLPIRHEARAAEWIQKIDILLAEKKGSGQLPKTGPKTLPWVIAAIVALLAILMFLVGLAVGGYFLDLNPEPTPESIQNVVVITATPLPATETPKSTRMSVPTETPKPTSTFVPTETPVPTSPPTDTAEPLSSDTDSISVIAGKWLFGSNVSALDDSTSYFIMLDAEDSIRAWLRDPTPSLIIRCEASRYDVYIFADTQLDSTLDDEVFTRVRYGNDPPVSVTMSESTTGEAMFFPNGRATVRNLLAVDRLVVGFTPFNANPVEAVFDLTGIETAIRPLFDECGQP